MVCSVDSSIALLGWQCWSLVDGGGRRREGGGGGGGGGRGEDEMRREKIK